MRLAALAIGLLVVGIAVGFGVGYVASPGKTFTTTTTVFSTITRTVTTTTAITPSIEYKFLDKYGNVQMAIAAHGKTVEISMSGHKIVVKLSEKLLTIEMPTPGSGTMLFEVKLYDTNGKLLATGSQTVSLFNVTRIDIPLNWIEKNPINGIESTTIH